MVERIEVACPDCGFTLDHQTADDYFVCRRDNKTWTREGLYDAGALARPAAPAIEPEEEAGSGEEAAP